MTNELDNRVFATNSYETLYWLAQRKLDNLERINAELRRALSETLEAHDCAGCPACDNAHAAIRNTEA